MTHLTNRAIVAAENKLFGENRPLPARPRKRDNEESRIQQGVIRWWAVACPAFGVPERMLFKIANDGMRSKAMAALMKREGLRAGTSDLMLAVPRGGKHGLFLELKKPTGVATDAQREFLKDVIAQGYVGRFAYSYDEATMAITEYLES